MWIQPNIFCYKYYIELWMQQNHFEWTTCVNKWIGIKIQLISPMKTKHRNPLAISDTFYLFCRLLMELFCNFILNLKNMKFFKKLNLCLTSLVENVKHLRCTTLLVYEFRMETVCNSNCCKFPTISCSNSWHFHKINRCKTKFEIKFDWKLKSIHLILMFLMNILGRYSTYSTYLRQIWLKIIMEKIHLKGIHTRKRYCFHTQNVEH